MDLGKVSVLPGYDPTSLGMELDVVRCREPVTQRCSVISLKNGTLLTKFRLIPEDEFVIYVCMDDRGGESTN